MQLRFSRRRFLSTSTISAVAGLPFMRAVMKPVQAASGPQFMFVMYHPFGVYHPEWFPNETGRNFSFKMSSSGLQAVKDDIIIVSKLDNGMGEKNECVNGIDQHQAGVSTVFANAVMKGKDAPPGGPTIDSVIARHLEPGRHHDEVVANLGVRATEHRDTFIRWVFRKTDGTTVQPQDDPTKAFASLFGGAATQLPGNPQKPFSGIKDALKDDLNRFEKGLAQTERQVFQQYMESFASFEKSLDVQTSGSSSCKENPGPEAFSTAKYIAAHRNPNIWNTARIQIQLAVLAMSCGARRVATMQLTDGFMAYLVPPGPHKDTLICHGHDLSHHAMIAGDPVRLRTNLNHAQALLFVDLVKALKAAPNPMRPGVMLYDDTLAIWSSCISGNGGAGHSKLRVPYTLAGGRNTGLVTGRHLDANFGTTGMMLRSICNLFGMKDQPYGEPEFSAKALGGLTTDVGVAGNYERKSLSYVCKGHAT